MDIFFLSKSYHESPLSEKFEAIFLFFIYLSFLLISIFFMFAYYIGRSNIYFYTEPIFIIAMGTSLILLIKGYIQYSVYISFLIYGNLFLLRTVIFPIFIIFEGYPFSADIYYAFQVILILGVGYFCKKVRGIFITIFFGFIINILHVVFYHTDLIISLILSNIMFIILPSILSLYIFKNKQLLYKYYKSNLNKNREINHRVKNHFTILKSMLNLKSSSNEYENVGIAIELARISHK